MCFGKESMGPDGFCSLLSVPPKPSFHSCCPTARLTGWACQVFGSGAPTPTPALTLERSEVTGAESQRLHSAMVPRGQVLVAVESSHLPLSFLAFPLPASLFTVYSQDSI